MSGVNVMLVGRASLFLWVSFSAPLRPPTLSLFSFSLRFPFVIFFLSCLFRVQSRWWLYEDIAAGSQRPGIAGGEFRSPAMIVVIVKREGPSRNVPKMLQEFLLKYEIRL